MAGGTRLPSRLLVGSCIDREGVAKLRAAPLVGVVTTLAGGRETGRRVVGIGDALVLGLVTGVTILRSTRELSADVAIRTSRLRPMSPRQRKVRLVVIEDCALPLRRAVANLALQREACRSMIRIVSSVEITLVTTDAGC